MSSRTRTEFTRPVLGSAPDLPAARSGLASGAPAAVAAGPHGSGAHVVSAPDVDPLLALLHDLRQPLAAIRLLSDGAGDDARLRGIHSQALWLNDLVEEVLGSTRGAAPQRCPVAPLVTEVVTRAAVSAACSLNLEIASDAVVYARPPALARAIASILDNAVRAAGADGGAGRVDVTVTSQGTNAVVSIQDDGPGFGRVPAHNALGLAIARAQLATCEGSLSLRSAHAGGVTAMIVVPALDVHEAVAS